MHKMGSIESTELTSVEKEAEDKARKTKLENDLKKLEDENRQLRLQLTGKMLEMSRFQDQVETLQATLEESKNYGRLQKTIERNSQLETELHHLRNVDEKFKLTKTKNQRLEQEVNIYKMENTLFENKLKQVKSQAKQQLANLNEDKKQLEREKDELSIQKNQMELEFKTKIENNNDQLQTLKTIIQIKRGEIESLRIGLKKEEAKKSRLNGDFEREKNQMELELKKEIEKLKDQLKTNKTIIEIQRDEIESLRNDLKCEEAKCNSMNGDFEREKKEMELELKTEIENLEDQLKTYKTIIQMKRDEIERLRNDLKSEEAKNWFKGMERGRNETELELETEIEKIKNEMNAYKRFIQIKRDEVERFRRDLNRKDCENNSLKEDLEGVQLRTTIIHKQLKHFKQSVKEWIETLVDILECNRRRADIELVISDLFEMKDDLDKSLKFFDKTKDVKLSHYHDVIRELVEAELSCSICMGTLKEAVTLKCSHTFCEECLETWKYTKMECPMCRAYIVDEYKTPAIDNVIEKMMACFPKESQTGQNGDHI